MQPARQRLLVDDLRVVGEVGGGRDDLVEQVDELVAADLEGLSRRIGVCHFCETRLLDSPQFAHNGEINLVDFAVDSEIEH